MRAEMQTFNVFFVLLDTDFTGHRHKLYVSLNKYY